MSSDDTDRVYRQRHNELADFRFDDTVVRVFPDMIRRSIPGYETVIGIAGLMAARCIQSGDLVYDLGCSQGASTFAVLEQLGPTDCQVIGIDNSEPMLASARERINDRRARFLCADVREVTYQPCRAVMLNYLLQFLDPDDRLTLLQRLHRALQPDGCLILSEKVHLDDPAVDARFDDLHLAFKRAQGYSELEIAQKRAALEQVMIIDSIATHRQRLKAAGFSRVELWFRCLNWASFYVQH